ncbi:MAG: energy transducer TonB [Acidobacteria bacterium]|nr:energy transducer TonB [Acidobacteriota bacterium]
MRTRSWRPRRKKRNGAIARARSVPRPARPRPPRPKKGGTASPDGAETTTAAASEKATVRVLLREKLQVNPALNDIVIQPDFTLELPRDYTVNLPPVMLWANSPLKLETGAVLEPVSRPDFSVASLPDLAPQVLPPNDEIALADLQIPAPAVVVENPALTLPPADVVPLAGQNPLADIAPPPTSAGDLGQNSLIVLSQQPDLQAIRFDLQPGFRLGSIDSSTPSGTLGPRGEGAAEGAGPAQNEPSTLTGVGKGSGSGEAAAGDGAGDLNDGDETGSPTGDGSSDLISSVRISGVGGVKIIELNGSGQGSAGGAGEGASGLGETGPGPGAGGDPDGDPKADGRLRPLPRSQYGIILVSNTRSDIPEANEVLTGTPIYTVYIDVPEAPRKWVLQYCVPRAPQPEEPAGGGGASNVIHIRSAERVDPPHALRTEPLRLELAEDGGAPRRVIVYAVVTEEGDLEDFRVIRGADPKTDQMVLANLQSWEFHPAFQNGEPVSVEAVFGIPLQ